MIQLLLFFVPNAFPPALKVKMHPETYIQGNDAMILPNAA